MKKLIIVESPTKARTIGQYLGKDYIVLSSQGHVRDLPRNDLGVDVESGFEPKFETKRTKQVAALREAAKGVERVYLATDHDREGEAIAFDLYTILRRVLKDEDAFVRPIFNEITKPVITEALKAPDQIDLYKVEAQRTRRILDRLVGYMVSPLLSRVLAGNRFEGLSAGRVQSAALRFLCDREAEIAEFEPKEYWQMDVHLHDGEPFVASLVEEDGEALEIGSKDEADRVVKVLTEATYVVAALTERERRRQPPPPFITSSLQQSASSSLGFTPKRTMRTAQELYEGVELPQGTVGMITYMRTDSVRMAEAAIDAARELIDERSGKRYLSEKRRSYRNKKRSQDAHEAIRPTDIRRTPASMNGHLSPDQQKLYALIYNRFLATQMAAAVYSMRTVTISADRLTLEASGSTVTFDGFLALYPKDRPDDPAIPEGLKEGERLTLDSVEPSQKFTEPPRRYSEAGLVRLLEKEGIGRPSTYASIVSVIQERQYAVREKGSLRPTLLGRVVVDFLKRYFSETVEPTFTAHMEEDLDQIEEGTLRREDALNEFYAPFKERLDALEDLLENGGERPFRVFTDVPCEACFAPMELRYWKGSHFLGCSTYPTCRQTVSLPPDIEFRFHGETLVLRDALEAASQGNDENIPCPACGSPMLLRNGRYGRYYRCSDPECGETASVSTGISCPRCREGELIEKYSQKRRRTFYSCNRYPECRFAVSQRPVKLCPVCEQGVLVEGKDGLRCSDKDCGHTEVPLEAGD